MAKIVVYGDIDVFPLYLKIDGGKEITVSGKNPQIFHLAAGSHEIAATTVSKIERITQGWGGGGFLSAATAALQNATNTTIGGVLDFAEDDVLLIKVEIKGLKSKVYNKMVSEAEVVQYLDINIAVTYRGRKSKKFKWLVWLLLFLFVVLAFMFLWVFMAEVNVSH